MSTLLDSVQCSGTDSVSSPSVPLENKDVSPRLVWNGLWNIKLLFLYLDKHILNNSVAHFLINGVYHFS